MKKVNNAYKSDKLIRVSLQYDESDNTIHSIIITGDFFLHPEEVLERLEANLVGTKLEKEPVMSVISTSLNGSKVFGFDPQSMTEAILGCLNK